MSEPETATTRALRRAACRAVAERSRPGLLAYPALVILLAVATERPIAPRWAVVASVLVLALLAGLRLVLVRRFEPLYDRHPRRWEAGFFGSLLLSIVLVAAGIHATLLAEELGPASLLALTAAAALGSVAVFVYSHFLTVSTLYIGLLAASALAGLAPQVGRKPVPAVVLGTAIATGYLLLHVRRQHRERWESLVANHRLTVRASELEEARDELRAAHEELAYVVTARSEELHRASRDYQSIFEAAHDAILIFRPEDERVLNVNRRACELYGFTREEFLNLSLTEVSADVPRGRMQITATLEKGYYYNFESVQYRKDGTRMDLEINASAIVYEGQPAILSINRDVTERRRAEDLRLAKEAAERAAQTKSQFLANMSHEIRTPMAGIIGLIDLLMKTHLEGQQKEYAQLIQTSAGALLQLIDDILDFSKIEADKLILELETFNLRSTLREVVDLLRFRAHDKGTELELTIADGLPAWVRGDPGRLRQVLVNLIGNAIKFTEAGRIDVEVRRGPKRSFRFSVRDTGVGIPVEAHDRLFELFSQADTSTSRRYGGTGLGLAISKRIVEMMGGQIGFESVPGKGSTFWFVVALEHALGPARDDEARAAAQLAMATPKPYRILVAEDNPINQLVITQQLLSLGYGVSAVANGEEVLAALDEEHFDLIFMDCQMPRLDGYEATRRVRARPRADRNIPIVALTANAMKGDLERCLAVGMNEYISKPFRQDTLIRTLERWLLGRQVAPPPEPVSSPAAASDDAIDPDRLASLRALGAAAGQDLLGELLARFRTQAQVIELRRALDAGDRAQLRFVAHSLKGSSGTLGAMRLSRLSAQLEEQAEFAPLAACAEQLALLGEEYLRVLTQLAEACEKEPARR